jgi:acyl carrier protein
VGGGIYYYQPKDHRLVLLNAEANINRDVHVSTNQSVFDESAFSIFLIGRMSAIAPMYGELAKDFSLLEAGYISQLLMTSARASQIGLCPIGGLDFPRIRGLFLLEESHVLLHSLVGGRIDTGDWQHPPPANTSARSTPTAPHSFQHNADGALINDLRNFLQGKLPGHMVPSSFVIMGALPLTSNGKVDRSALPFPDEARPDSKKTYVAPRTDIEKTLTTILQEVLQVQAVGIQDNFFDLGANSLHMVQVHSKLQAVLHRDISVKEMFKYPTVSLFAEYLNQQQPSDQSSFQRTHEQARKQLEAIKRQKQRLGKKENE